MYRSHYHVHSWIYENMLKMKLETVLSHRVRNSLKNACKYGRYIINSSKSIAIIHISSVILVYMSVYTSIHYGHCHLRLTLPNRPTMPDIPSVRYPWHSWPNPTCLPHGAPSEVVVVKFQLLWFSCQLSIAHTMHGTGIFTYMDGWFLWFSCR